MSAESAGKYYTICSKIYIVQVLNWINIRVKS